MNNYYRLKIWIYLKNNLKDYDLTKISEVLAKYHYDLQVRPYKLSKEIYCDIANNLSI